MSFLSFLGFGKKKKAQEEHDKPTVQFLVHERAGAHTVEVFATFIGALLTGKAEDMRRARSTRVTCGLCRHEFTLGEGFKKGEHGEGLYCPSCGEILMTAMTNPEAIKKMKAEGKRL